MTPTAESPQSEREKVESWRLHVLVEAGYPLSLAEKIAHSEADLHRAVELVLDAIGVAQRHGKQNVIVLGKSAGFHHIRRDGIA